MQNDEIKAKFNNGDDLRENTAKRILCRVCLKMVENPIKLISKEDEEVILRSFDYFLIETIKRGKYVKVEIPPTIEI